MKIDELRIKIRENNILARNIIRSVEYDDNLITIGELGMIRFLEYENYTLYKKIVELYLNKKEA